MYWDAERTNQLAFDLPSSFPCAPHNRPSSPSGGAADASLVVA